MKKHIIIDLFKSNSINIAIEKFIKLIIMKLFSHKITKNERKFIENTISKKNVIVIAKTIEWNFAFQRIQQLAIEFSKRDIIVIYVTQPFLNDFFMNIKSINHNLFEFNFKNYANLNQLLKGAKSVTLYITNLNNYEDNLKLRYDKLVYEYIDELDLFFDDLTLAQKLHNNILKRADLSIATASKLYNDIQYIANKSLLSENAGDYDFFSKTSNCPANQTTASICENYEVSFGYYGMLADWVDFEFIKEVAKANPKWCWILIGPRHKDYDINQHKLDTFKNIYLLGPQPYQKLPSLIKNVDFLTIPFKVNKITESTSPVKLFEYMAIKKPIITSKMQECLKYKSVNTYTNISDFVSIVNNGDFDEKYFNIMNQEAKENTWESRANIILKEIGLI